MTFDKNNIYKPSSYPTLMIYGGTIGSELKIRHPSFKKKNFRIRAKVFEKRGLVVHLTGKITGAHIPGHKLERNNQEKLILELFSEYGEGFIRYLDGYFFIIIYKKKTNELLLYNNRYSQTCCYYFINEGIDGGFAFSDSISSLLVLLPSKPKPNFDVVNMFLNSGYIYSGKTLFENVYRLVPGHYLKYEENKIKVIRYTEMNFQRKPIRNLKKKLAEYEYLWQKAIKDFCHYNEVRKVGAALSGGNDTTWVMWNASQVHQEPVHSYTCHYQYSLFNEIKKARFVTKICKGVHHEVEVDENDLALLPEAIELAEEPVLASAISVYKMMKIARQDVDLFLTGDGGNNIYNHLYPVTEIHKYVKNLPPSIRMMMYKIVGFLAHMTGWERLWELKYVLHGFKGSYKNLYPNLTCYRHFCSEERKRLFREQHFREPPRGHLRIAKENFDDDLIQARFIYGNMQYVSSFHEKFAKGLDMKLLPVYQNQAIMDFLCSLPLEMLNRGNTLQLMTNRAEKMYFQKLALKKYFPEWHVYNAGQPFDQPFHGWFQRKPELIKSLFRRLRKRGWYNQSYLNQLYKEHRKQNLSRKIYCQLSNHGYRIMALLALEIWCMIYLDDMNKNSIMELFKDG